MSQRERQRDRAGEAFPGLPTSLEINEAADAGSVRVYPNDFWTDEGRIRAAELEIDMDTARMATTLTKADARQLAEDLETAFGGFDE